MDGWVAVQKARSLGHEFIPLGALLEGASVIPAGRMAFGTVPGRDGWVAVQKVISSVDGFRGSA